MDILIFALIEISVLNFCNAAAVNMPVAAIADTFTLPPIGSDASSMVALENWQGARSNQAKITSLAAGEFVDCSESSITLCNQGAWADFGIAVSGFIPKQNLCTKYTPPTSCVPASLANCNHTMGDITKTMMIAFGRVVVSWCYDGGARLMALDSYTTCLSVSMFDAMTIRHCLTQINDPVAVGKPVDVTNDVGDSQRPLFSLPKLLNNVIDTYQSSTIACMYGAIEEACGKEAAELSLGPAMEELMSIVPPKPKPTASRVTTSDPIKNDTHNETRPDEPPQKKKQLQPDLYAKSRPFIAAMNANHGTAAASNYLQMFMVLIIVKFVLYLGQ